MFIEVLSIGDEILKGETLNTNASFIGRQLVREGWTVSRQTTLPDQEELLVQGLKDCLERADVIIATGGLGPTLDDITLNVSQKVFQKEPTFVKNPVGSAPGLLYSEKGKLVIFLPGVPLEMEEMLKVFVIPLLKEKYPSSLKSFHQELHFGALNESMVDPLLRDITAHDSKLQVGIYPSHGTLTIRLTSDHQDSVERAKTQILKKFHGDLLSTQRESLQESLHAWFISHRKTLAFAESCTGGLLSTHITALAGASQYFLGSMIVYSNDLKEKLLGVSPQTLSSFGAVSLQTVDEMLKGLFHVTQTDFGIAVSGIAGPSGGSLEKPVGTVFYALGHHAGKQESGSFLAKGNRKAVMHYATNVLLGKLLKYVKNYG